MQSITTLKSIASFHRILRKNALHITLRFSSSANRSVNNAKLLTITHAPILERTHHGLL